MYMVYARLLRWALVVTSIALWLPADGKQVHLVRQQFVLGVHTPGEKVLEIVTTTASWYEGHQVELVIRYPVDAADGDRVRLSCIEVVIIYGVLGRSTESDDATGNTVEPRVHIAAGGLGESFAKVTVEAADVTFFNHTTLFYGFR